jgi:outer membrane murein-binding lipoprotein Lpp
MKTNSTIKSRLSVLFAIVFALLIAAGCGSVTDAGLTKAPTKQELNAKGKDLSVTTTTTANNNKGYDATGGSDPQPIIIR